MNQQKKAASILSHYIYTHPPPCRQQQDLPGGVNDSNTDQLKLKWFDTQRCLDAEQFSIAWETNNVWPPVYVNNSNSSIILYEINEST